MSLRDKLRWGLLVQLLFERYIMGKLFLHNSYSVNAKQSLDLSQFHPLEILHGIALRR